MGASLSILPGQDHELQEYCTGSSQDDGICCVHRNSVRRKREENKAKSGQARGFIQEQDKNQANGLLAKHGTIGIWDSQTSQASTSADQKYNSPEIKDGRSSLGSSIPVWRRDPEPLPDWTPEQQRVFMNQLDENPLYRKNSEHLKRAIEKTHRLIPEKTIEEIELCFKHLQMKRIGYFGPEESRSSAFMRRTSKSHPR